MLIKTSELTGPALDWAVASCLGQSSVNIYGHNVSEFIAKYSTDWTQGGPIIELEGISPRHLIGWSSWGKWEAKSNREDHQQFGPTALIAAMRCYVASKLGDEVTIPEELLT